MPWGYTVNSANTLFLYNTDSLNYRVYMSLRMEGAFLVSHFLFSNTTTHAVYSAAREFNSKAAKAIWDLKGIVSPARSQFTHSPTSD